MVSSERLIPFGLVLLAVCLTVTGELFLKSGMNRIGPLSLATLSGAIGRMLATPPLWFGFGFIACGGVVWLVAISRAPLSWAYPMLSLGYVLILVFSRLILGEAVAPVRWGGVAVIILGVYLIFRS
jgi:multidrug transporter EmrE-like cation transporter